MHHRSAIALAVALVVAGCSVHRPVPRAKAGVDERIRFYSEKLERLPDHYPSWASLGRAHLDRARESLNPDDVARAREALERSIAIQPSFEAFKLMAALSGFRHRFRDSLAWGSRAREAWPADTEVVALLVDAHVALGEIDDAAKLIAERVDETSRDEQREDFHLAVARAHLLAARDDREGAVAAYLDASALASKLEHTGLAAWARTSAAGVWIDAGDSEKARRLLNDVKAAAEQERFVAVHRAELLVLEGDPASALAIYESLASRTENPELHRRAFSIARGLGLTADARRHFEAAERGFRRAVDAGEVYSLEELARLYTEAGVRLEEAAALARRNLEYKRDAGARETLARIELLRLRTLPRDGSLDPSGEPCSDASTLRTDLYRGSGRPGAGPRRTWITEAGALGARRWGRRVSSTAQATNLWKVAKRSTNGV